MEDYRKRMEWINTAIRTDSEKSPLYLYLIFSGKSITNFMTQHGLGPGRSKRILDGLRPTEEEIDIISDFLEVEVTEVKRLTFAKPLPESYVAKHQYMLSPDGAPFIVQNGRANREMDGWKFISKKEAFKMLSDKHITPRILKIVFENPTTGKPMLKKTLSDNMSFGWEVYGLK